MYCELKERWRCLYIMREGCVDIYVVYMCVHAYIYIHTHPFYYKQSVGNSRGLKNYPVFFHRQGN